jgi:LPS export ABC transporter protein LptC
MSGRVACVLSIALAVVSSSCGRTSGPADVASPSASTKARGPVYHISAHGTNGRPVTITNIVSGVPEYTLEAATVIYATDLAKARFTDTTLHFYKGRKPRLTVTAPTAVVNEISHDVALSGGVHAITAAGVTLSSDEMNYSEKTRLLTAVGHVVAVEPGGNMLTGGRAIADLDLQQIHLFAQSPVAATAASAAPPSATP